METMGRRRVQVQAAAVLVCCLLLATSPHVSAAGFCFKDCWKNRCGPNPSPISCFLDCTEFCDPFAASKAAVPKKNSAGAIIAAPPLPDAAVPPVSARKLKPGQSPKS